MSKYPVPVRPKRMTFFSPVSLHFLASSIVTLMAWADSGAGRMPSTLANSIAALNTSTWLTALASLM